MLFPKGNSCKVILGCSGTVMAFKLKNISNAATEKYDFVGGSLKYLNFLQNIFVVKSLKKEISPQKEKYRDIFVLRAGEM